MKNILLGCGLGGSSLVAAGCGQTTENKYIPERVYKRKKKVAPARLYKLKEDIAETNNLVEKYPEKVAELEELIQSETNK